MKKKKRKKEKEKEKEKEKKLILRQRGGLALLIRRVPDLLNSIIKGCFPPPPPPPPSLPKYP